MRGLGAVVSKAEAPLAAKEPEAITDFERQNPASKKLLEEIDSVFEEALTNMAKEVEAFLRSAAK